MNNDYFQVHFTYCSLQLIFMVAFDWLTILAGALRLVTCVRLCLHAGSPGSVNCCIFAVANKS